MRNILIIMAITGLTWTLHSQNFVKNYYVGDHIDAGLALFEFENHYLLQITYEDTASENNKIQLPYSGMIKTDTSGNLLDMILFDTTLGAPGVQRNNEIYMGMRLSEPTPFNSKKLVYGRINEEGKAENHTEVLFNEPHHVFYDNKMTETKLYCSDLVYKCCDKLSIKEYTIDSIMIHRFDTNMVYEKTIVCPFSYPRILEIASEVLNDNLFVTAIMILDTLKQSSGLNFTVIAFDSLGQKLWEYPLADDVWYNPMEAISITKLSDNSVVVLSSYIAEFAVLRLQRFTRIDQNGKLVWDYKDFFDSTVQVYNLFKIFSTRNDEIMALGANYNNSDDEYPNSHQGFIMRLSKDGEVRWTRRVQDDSSYFKLISFWNGIELASGGFLITGYLKDNTKNIPTYNTSVLLVKFDSLGCIHPGCDGYQTFSSVDDVLMISPGIVNLNPNPAGAYIRLSWSELPSYAERYVIYSITGQELLSGKMEGHARSMDVDTSALVPGMYVVKLSGKGWESVAAKFVKE